MSVTKVTGMMQTSTKGGDISSASPTVIDTDGDYFDVTGTTNFAAFTVVAGRRFTVQFDGALTMTHHATTLDLPGGANITTAAGDVAEFFATGTNTVQCVNYTKADGTAVVSSAHTGNVAFPATQSADAGANVLDDYEEGQFTPSIQDNTLSDSESQAYGTQVGFYTKIGNMVHISGRVETSSIGSLTTSQTVRMAGLPFTSVNSASRDACLAIGSGDGLALTAGYNLAFFVNVNATTVNGKVWDTAAGSTNLTIAEWSANGGIRFGGCYTAA